ncbi:MAG: hypothetical protein MJZ16_01665 [Bacteroidales bacterium]|nr:hypothetical protein [Bacteroidales bacterium]
MIFSENIGEGLAIQMTVAKAVAKYAEGKELSKKLTELLKTLLYENMKEDATDEAMTDLLAEECDDKRLDPEDVMKHFEAITSDFAELIKD